MFATRRHFLAGLGAAGIAAAATASAQALHAADFGLEPDGPEDQTARLHAACTAARDSGRPLMLGPGQFRVKNLELFGNIVIEGTPERSVLIAIEGQPAAIAHGFSGVVLRQLDFREEMDTQRDAAPCLLLIRHHADLTVERCRFNSSRSVGIMVENAAAAISDCGFRQMRDAAIHAMDSKGLLIRNNRISDCGNAGIRIWRSQSGPDGSIVTGNRIANIDWRGGGNGQNGNGINIFRADEVIIADNHIADCAFTAVRLNATNNCQVSGNLCLRSGEVAIFSEFGFSGSVIASNIIDGAAAGISITNLDSGGQLAVCSGNIVRNITAASPVNPDTVPIGILAEADTAITGNSVQSVPGVGIVAGHGPYLRNVVIAGNMVSDAMIGIGVSVVEGAGSVTLGANHVEARQHQVVGLAWTEVVETDLLANAGRFGNVRVE